MRTIALLCIAVLLLSGNVIAQNQQQRLAIEQQQVADQLRRLNSLLVELEASERIAGNVELAATLASVQQYMNDATGIGDLVTALQKVSQQLSQRRNASALSSQALLIEQLQVLLDMLLNSQADIEAEKQKKILEQRAEKLDDMINRQQQLLEDVQQLKEKQQQGDLIDADKQQMAELQQQQQKLADETQEFNKQQQQQGIKSETAEDAQRKQQDAAAELEQQDAAQAEQDQQQALEELQKAQQQVEQQQQQNASKAKQEALMNVELEIKEILASHQVQQLLLEALFSEYGEDDLPRSARVKLRKAATAEENISIRADDLLLEIAQAGADSFPFYILSLMEDHKLLAEQLTASSTFVKEQDIELGKYLSESWIELLDVIATERERERQQSENPQQGDPQDEEDTPLVQFATELQLLKRMQLALAKRIKHAQNTPKSAEFKQLVERQNELQLQYESMIRRLSSANDKTKSEEI